MELILGRPAFRIAASTSCSRLTTALTRRSTSPLGCSERVALCDLSQSRSRLFDTFTRLVASRDRTSTVRWSSLSSTARKYAPCHLTTYRFYADEKKPETKDAAPTEVKQSVFQKMKQMTKDYWHVLIPVHVVTSIGWLALFYSAAKNGIDIGAIVETLHVSEKYAEMMKGSDAGFWAITYALYKIFTPLRYTVTVGGTTLSIRYLSRWGYLKTKSRSAPSK